jgi:hypothetical protein
MENVPLIVLRDTFTETWGRGEINPDGDGGKIVAEVTVVVVVAEVEGVAADVGVDGNKLLKG